MRNSWQTNKQNYINKCITVKLLIFSKWVFGHNKREAISENDSEEDKVRCRNWPQNQIQLQHLSGWCSGDSLWITVFQPFLISLTAPLIRTFVSSLDEYKSLLNIYSWWKYSAARILTNTPCREHVTPELYCLFNVQLNFRLYWLILNHYMVWMHRVAQRAGGHVRFLVGENTIPIFAGSH